MALFGLSYYQGTLVKAATEIYSDRIEAGEILAGHIIKEIQGIEAENPVVAGLPRGGVIVAYEVAKRLNCGLDVIMAGKLRAPGNPEFAIGAVTEDGLVYLNKSALSMLNVGEPYIETEKKERLSALRERLKNYRKVKKKIPLKGRTVIIVDDGLATGSTMISAIQAAHAEGAKKIIAAIPGGPQDTVRLVESMTEVDRVICPLKPEPFFAVSQLYMEFGQVEDKEVIEILREGA